MFFGISHENMIEASGFRSSMSARQNWASVLAVVVVGVLILGAMDYTFSLTTSQVSSLSQQNSSLNQQVSGGNAEISSLDQQIGSLNQQVNSANQQISTLVNQVSTLEQRTLSVVTMTNTVISVVSTTISVTSTVTSVSAVPTSSLVIVADSYSNSTYTFTFQVHNNENYTIYAQVSASLYGGFVGGNCQSTLVGNFISQLYTFDPGMTTQTTLDLALGSYTGCANPSTNVVDNIMVDFTLPPSTPVSPTYSFNVVPSYVIS
jgi:hypothetical protein